MVFRSAGGRPRLCENEHSESINLRQGNCTVTQREQDRHQNQISSC